MEKRRRKKKKKKKTKPEPGATSELKKAKSEKKVSDVTWRRKKHYRRDISHVPKAEQVHRENTGTVNKRGEAKKGENNLDVEIQQTRRCSDSVVSRLVAKTLATSRELRWKIEKRLKERGKTSRRIEKKLKNRERTCLHKRETSPGFWTMLAKKCKNSGSTKEWRLRKKRGSRATLLRRLRRNEFLGVANKGKTTKFSKR